MESARNHYYSITNRMLSLAGQWPYQERSTRLFRVSLLTVTALSLIVPQVAKFIHCNGNIRCITLTVPMCMLLIINLVKLYTCQFNSNKIKNLTDHLRNDWNKLESAEEYEIMKTYAAKASQFSLAYVLHCYMAGAIFVSISLVPHILNVILPVNESRPIFMPYEAYYFVDGEKYFFYIFFHLFVCLEITVTAVVAHDCMLLVYTEHVCSLFAVARFRFGTLSRNNRDNAVNNSLDNVYNRKIALSVYIHWRALRFAKLLENTFCVTLVIQIMIIIIAMTVTLLQVAMQLDEVMNAMRYMFCTFGQLIHLFCFSLQSQKLIDHSVQIRDEIYNFSWYNIPVKSQKLLLYVMRSIQPNFLSAGKIYIFSLKNFLTVVQSSVSYFIVLASLK